MDLGCIIYIHSSQTREELTKLIANILEGQEDGYTVAFAGGEVDIVKNDMFEAEKIVTFPDGFLYFSFLAEFYFHPDLQTDQWILFTRKILLKLWENNIPAIASCDFEEALPEKGGYKSLSIPWPTHKK